MEAVWLCLYTSYRGVLESAGGNEYIRHSGMRSLRGTSAVRKVQGRVTEATKKFERNEGATRQRCRIKWI